MRHLLLLALMLSSSVTITAQDDKQIALQDSTLESMPSFPCGQAALFQFLSKTIKYPVTAEKNKIQGRVIVGFYIEVDGTVTDVQVKKSVDPTLDKEAVRVVKSMPKWIPGKKGGKPVRVKYTMPITFRLAGKTEDPMVTDEFLLRTTVAMVVFEQDKSTVNKSEYSSIKRVANYMLKHPKDTIIIKGYTRAGLSTKRSQKLSEERAKAVKKILVQRCFISANRIIATGMGATNRFDSQGDLNDVVICTSEIRKKVTNHQMMTNRLNEELGLWNKQMPNETLEAYQLRVNDQTRGVKARDLEYDISTQMATNLLPSTQITFGDYNPNLKKLAVHATSMPDFYLDMDEKEAASLYGTSNVQIRNQKYTLHPDDSFELVYAEVYNPATGKTYTFNNLQKMSLNSIRNDNGYIPLRVVNETQMKETRLTAIKDDMISLAKNENVITDHTHISVNSNAVPAKDVAGNSIINYNVGIAYEVEEEFSSRDDFKPGRYVTTESKAAMLMLQIMKKAFEDDFRKYLTDGKQVIVKIKGTADALLINRPLAYNGQYGEYNDQTVYTNEQPTKLSLTTKEGIATNEQLSFARALGVKNWIEQEVAAINKMKRNYEYQIEVSSEKGSKYRRISVEYTFVDAF